jgi:hypothetical protein
MGKTIGRLKLLFIVIFVVAAGWLWIDQLYNVQPREKCEEAQGWWSPELRECRKPVTITAKETPALTALKRKIAADRAREKAGQAPPPAPRP